MAAMGVVRVFTGPVLGVAADALAARRLFIIVLMLVAALSYAGYLALAGFAFVVLFSLTSSAAFSAIGPLLEGVTLRTAMAHGFDYGRVRLWGSAAFVAMNFAGGAIIAANGIDQFSADADCGRRVVVRCVARGCRTSRRRRITASRRRCGAMRSSSARQPLVPALRRGGGHRRRRVIRSTTRSGR